MLGRLPEEILSSVSRKRMLQIVALHQDLVKREIQIANPFSASADDEVTLGEMQG